MLSTLAIMENANSESEVLGLGLSVSALNLGMYIGLPAFGILRLYQISIFGEQIRMCKRKITGQPTYW